LLGGKAREVRVVDADDPAVDWTQHVDPRVTLVVLGGADRVVDIARALAAAGRPTATPVAITRGGTTVEQRTVVTTIAEVAAAVKASKQAGPGLVVIGETVGMRDKLSWFETKPLFGWRVLVPRTKEQAGALSEQLTRYGAVGVEVPTISVEPPRTPQQMDRAITGLVSGRFQWVAFTSVNAVRAVREKFEEYGLDARAFAGLKVAAVGEQTAAALTAFGVRPDLVPSGEQSSVGLLEDFPEFDPIYDPMNRVFLPRADIATDT
jgi:uroporphyrinogen III methyltransferase/synthase